jgi:hypothetical protein
MAHTAIARDVHQSLDVHLDFTAKIAFDAEFAFDDFTSDCAVIECASIDNEGHGITINRDKRGALRFANTGE